MYFDALAATLFVQQWFYVSGGAGIEKQVERHASSNPARLHPAPPLFFLAQR